MPFNWQNGVVWSSPLSNYTLPSQPPGGSMLRPHRVYVVNSSAGTLGPEFRQKMDQPKARWEEVLYGPVLRAKSSITSLCHSHMKKSKGRTFVSASVFLHLHLLQRTPVPQGDRMAFGGGGRMGLGTGASSNGWVVLGSVGRGGCSWVSHSVPLSGSLRNWGSAKGWAWPGCGGWS